MHGNSDLLSWEMAHKQKEHACKPEQSHIQIVMLFTDSRAHPKEPKLHANGTNLHAHRHREQIMKMSKFSIRANFIKFDQICSGVLSAGPPGTKSGANGSKSKHARRMEHHLPGGDPQTDAGSAPVRPVLHRFAPICPNLPPFAPIRPHLPRSAPICFGLLWPRSCPDFARIWIGFAPICFHLPSFAPICSDLLPFALVCSGRGPARILLGFGSDLL